MDQFAPPPGPPPPTVPEGWKAVYNDQYKEWFYVNLHTKASQWNKPTSPAVAPRPDGSAPPGPPPGYDHSTAQATGPEKPHYGGGSGPGGNLTEDEKLARKLQDEENARGTASRGASDSYYGGANSAAQPQSGYGQQPPQQQQSYGQQQPGYGQQQQPSYAQESEKSKGGGLFGKLASKLGGGSSRPPQQQYGGGGYPQQGYPPQQYGGGYPPQQYGGGGYGAGYGQAPPRKSGGGMGMGGIALGAGAGLVGGALLMDAMDDHDQNEYQQGYEAGQDNNDNNDYGGGDDYGGDDGGGDF